VLEHFGYELRQAWFFDEPPILRTLGLCCLDLELHALLQLIEFAFYRTVRFRALGSALCAHGQRDVTATVLSHGLRVIDFQG
jgi:hypothetical protein